MSRFFNSDTASLNAKKAVQNAEQAAKRDAVSGLNQRGRKLFADPKEHVLDADTRTACTNRGVVNEPAIKDAQAAARAARRPLWQENPNMTVQEDRALRQAGALPASGRALEARNEAAIELAQVPVYRTRGDVMKLGAEVDAAVQARPLLNAEMKRGAGSDPRIFKTRIEDRADAIGAKPKRGIFG